MTNEDIVRIGKEILEIESEAVMALAEALDENFARAVVLLSQAESRVIVTGIGKSGLVARKIAATLASCGTPSLFIHPVEAGHGDLGMIVEKDIMIVLSYSGDTREVVDLLEFVKRFGIKLIGITGNKKSQLARYSDVVLEAKVSREAEASGLIPTASTTAALALGDALAITLMKMKGFGQDDFAFFHPKGQAGKKLTKISHLMHMEGQIPQVSAETTMQEVLQARIPKTYPRVKGGHFEEWTQACKGGEMCGSNFDYAGPFTETVLLGNLAIRTKRRLEWDSEKMEVTNFPEANRFVTKEYQPGWGV